MEPSVLEARLSLFRENFVESFTKPVILNAARLAGITNGGSGHPSVLTLEIGRPEDSFEDISQILNFLASNFFPQLPHIQQRKFPPTLFEPIISPIMELQLKSHLPDSLLEVPSFMTRLGKAVDFEAEIVRLGISGRNDIRMWANAADVHYERSRSNHALEKSRDLVRDASGGTITVEMMMEPTLGVNEPEEPPSRYTDTTDMSWGFGEGGDEADGWGFDDEESTIAESPTPSGDVDNDENGGWGWDDETEPDSHKQGESHSPEVSRTSSTRAATLRHATRLEKLSKEGLFHY